MVYDDHFDLLEDEYDSEVDEDDFTWDWSVDGNVITGEKSFAWDDNPETTSWEGDTEIEYYIVKITVDESTGIFSLLQLINDDEEVLYEWGTVSAIPGYELPILLGITAACTIGLIYIIRKRK
ncbi:MAG: Loki-CTERM sorting domain-containing protein [Promethearchaeota archaeon]